MKKTIIYIAIFLSAITANASNYAYDFTGSSVTYLTTTNAPLSGNANFTIELWFNINGNSTGTYGRLIGFNGIQMEIGVNNNNVFVYDGTNWRSTSTTNVSTGWHHIAVTNNGTNFMAYLDGVQVMNNSSPTFNFSNKKMSIGSAIGSNSNTDRARAYYDEVRVWNTAKTLSQINADRVKQLIGNETNLVSYYKMNDLKDAGPAANTLVLTGSGTKKTFKFGLYINDYCMNFDATDDNLELSGSHITGTSNFTIELLFKTSTGTASLNRLIGWDNFQLEVGLDQNGTVSVYQGNWSVSQAKGMNDNVWHHLAVVRANTQLLVYVDGARVYVDNNCNLNLSGKMYIGGNNTSSSGISIGGSIDEVRIWNTFVPINNSQIDTTLIGNETNLVSYFDFNTPNTTSTVPNLVQNGTSFTKRGINGNNNLPVFGIKTSNVLEPSITQILPSAKCGPGKLKLYAYATNNIGTVNWYNAASGGSSIYTGTNYNTPTLSTTTTYYVDATLNGVTTNYRKPVLAEIFSIPEVSVSSNKNSICKGEIAILTAEGGSYYEWINLNNSNQSDTSIIRPNITTTYYVVGSNSNNCSDTTNITITVNSVNAGVTKNNKTLTSDESGATYQWVDCVNEGIISNATQQSFTPTQNGNYAVIVTKNGCKDTSECINVIVNNSSVNDFNHNNFKIYPNPFDHVINIDNVNLSIKSMILYDQLGRKLIELNIINQLNQIDLSLLNSGVYTLELISNQGESIKNKIIKN